MDVKFVAHEGDTRALEALKTLEPRYPVRVLQNGGTAEMSEIALFTSDGRYANSHLSIAVPRFRKRDIKAPAWAETTPFQIALRSGVRPERKAGGFSISVRDAAEWYRAWDPHLGQMTPWHVSPQIGEDTMEFYQTWARRARKVVPSPRFKKRMEAYLTPVFPVRDDFHIENPVLVVMGCAPFNAPHTDVADRLLPEKAAQVVNHLTQLIEVGGFREVRFVVPDGSILAHHALRASLHPFFFMSVEEVEHVLRKPFVGTTRLFGRTGVRTDEEIVEALNEGGDAIVCQIVEPLREKVETPIREVSWIDHIGPYLDEGWDMAQKHRELAEAIYEARVRTREWYATLHRINPDMGLARTLGNNAIYCADALYMAANPDCVTADYEVDDQFWHGLASILTGIWGGTVPFIGSVHPRLRQPWAY